VIPQILTNTQQPYGLCLSGATVNAPLRTPHEPARVGRADERLADEHASNPTSACGAPSSTNAPRSRDSDRVGRDQCREPLGDGQIFAKVSSSGC